MRLTDTLELFTLPDHWLMRRLQNWKPPVWFRLWMILSTRAGDGGLWYALAAGVLAFGGARRYTVLASEGMAVGAGIMLFRSLKRLIGRKRPCAIEPHCWTRLLPPDQFSFPSGHSITAFAMSVATALFFPGLTTALLFCAISVALSRIVLGMHFLTDVVAGCLIGGGLGYASYLFVCGMHHA